MAKTCLERKFASMNSRSGPVQGRSPGHARPLLRGRLVKVNVRSRAAFAQAPRCKLLLSDTEGYGRTCRASPAAGDRAVRSSCRRVARARPSFPAASGGPAAAARSGHPARPDTYGTGNFMLLNTGETPVPSKAGLLTTVCYKLGDAPAVSALEGIGCSHGLPRCNGCATNSAVIATAVRGGNTGEHGAGQRREPVGAGVLGLFAPVLARRRTWRDRGLVAVQHQGSSRARATLEAICFQTRAVLDAMTIDSGVSLAVG